MCTATAPIGINHRLKDVADCREISSSRTVIVAAKYIPHKSLASYFFENRCRGDCPPNHAVTRSVRWALVGAGFAPAFKFKQRIVLVVERGLEARGYVLEADGPSSMLLPRGRRANRKISQKHHRP